MTAPRPTPSIGRILASDYASTLCAIGPVVTWGLWLALDVLELGRGGPSGPLVGGLSTMLVLALATSALCVPLLVRRVRGIQAVFARGVEVEGQVLAIGFDSDRGTVEVGFTFEGQARRVARAISRNARTSALRPGEPVALVVDPADPERAFIRDLFV